jgi:hypothetical protein
MRQYDANAAGDEMKIFRNSRGEWVALIGRDPIVEHLRDRALPVTRENYLLFAYPEGAPDPMPGELEAIVQEALKNATLREGYSEEGLAESLAWQKHRERQRRL